MEFRINKKTGKYVLLAVLACILFAWLLNETERVQSVLDVLKSVLSPFIIGSVLAFIINVPMRGIEKRLGKLRNAKLRRCISITATLLAILLLLTLVFILLIPQVGDTAETFVERVPEFVQNVETKVNNFLNNNPQIMELLSEYTDFSAADFSGLIEKVVDWIGGAVLTILEGTIAAIGSLAGTMMNVVIGIVFAIYCLFQKELLARQGRRLIYAFLPEKYCDEIVRIMRLSNSTFSNFLTGQCLEVCILGVMFAISMAIFGMPYIPLVSVLVAVTAFIPIVGAFVGCIIGALFILVEAPMLAVWFVVLFLVLQQIENNLIYPRVVGTSIGLPGMWVLVAVAVGGEFMGVAGMFLMIPLFAVLYTLMREIVQKRLTKRGIANEKLLNQPPELKSKFAERRERRKLKKSKKNDIIAEDNQSDLDE